TRAFEITISEIYRRRQIIPRIRRPDPEIVKTSGDDDLLLLLCVELALSETEVHHPIDVIPVTVIGVAEYFVDERDFGFDFHLRFGKQRIGKGDRISSPVSRLLSPVSCLPSSPSGSRRRRC